MDVLTTPDQDGAEAGDLAEVTATTLHRLTGSVLRQVRQRDAVKVIDRFGTWSPQPDGRQGGLTAPH